MPTTHRLYVRRNLTPSTRPPVYLLVPPSAPLTFILNLSHSLNILPLSFILPPSCPHLLLRPNNVVPRPQLKLKNPSYSHPSIRTTPTSKILNSTIITIDSYPPAILTTPQTHPIRSIHPRPSTSTLTFLLTSHPQIFIPPLRRSSLLTPSPTLIEALHLILTASMDHLVISPLNFPTLPIYQQTPSRLTLTPLSIDPINQIIPSLHISS